MAILILSLGSLVSVGFLLHSFQRFKKLYKAKQDPVFVIGNLVIPLIEFGILSLLLTALFKAVLGAAGAKTSFAPRLFAVELAYLCGCLFLLLCLGFYVVAVRLPTAAINRRRQRKELARLGWQIRKPGQRLDGGEFKHLFIIGVNLWKPEDMRGIETLQHHIQHDDWTVQVLFLDDTDAWPTPTVREYQDGVLVRRLSGKDALTWMKQA